MLDKVVTNGNSDDAYKSMELVYKIYCSDSDWKEKYNLGY